MAVAGTSRRLIRNIVLFNPVRCMSGEWGSGAGKGGGAGGSVREAGGSFGKMEAAREEEYFRKLQAKQLKELAERQIQDHKDEIKFHKQAQQLEALRDHHKEELNHHEQSIQQHKEAIERHRKKIQDLENLDKKKHDSDSD